MVSRVGNFIIGASGSDKKMLYGSSEARAVLTISDVNKTEKRWVCHLPYHSVFMALDLKKGRM